MKPPRRPARPLVAGFALVALVLAALASPPLAGLWESTGAGAGPSGTTPPTDPPTTPTSPPTSGTTPPTVAPTSPPTVPPTSAAPPVTRVPTPTSATPRPSTTRDTDEEEVPAVETTSTTTTTLPQLLVPAENRPDAGGEDGDSTSTVAGDGGLGADTKVWLSVVVLLLIGLAIGALTLFYFFHTRPDDDHDDDHDGAADAERDDRELVGAGVGVGVGVGVGAAASGSSKLGGILGGEAPTMPVPVVPAVAEVEGWPDDAAEPDPDAEPAPPADAPSAGQSGLPDEIVDHEGPESDAGPPDDPLSVLTRLLAEPPPSEEPPA